MFKFKNGDKVTHNMYGGAVFTVLSAHPLWQIQGRPGYLLEHSDGGVMLAVEPSLTAVPGLPSEGDSVYLAGIRVTVLSGPHPGAGFFGGAPMYMVGYGDGTARSVPAEELTAEPDYSPAAFPRNAQYRDKEGDVWSFTYLGTHDESGCAAMTCPGYFGGAVMLRRVVNMFGPLTRI